MKRDPAQILIEVNERLTKEMNELFDEITSLIRIADPIKLVEDLSSRLIIFNDFHGNSNSFLTLSQLEFILGLLLSREQYVANEEKLTLDSYQIATLASKVEKYFTNWTFTYHYKNHNKIPNDAESEKDRLISSLVTHHSTVRGDTFYDQEGYQLLALFNPFKKWMDDNLGFNIEDATIFVDRITDYYSNKLDCFFNSSLPPDSSRNSIRVNQRFRNKNQTYSLDQLRGLLIFQESNILGLDENNSIKFNSFLDCFSVEYGHSFNENFKFPSDTNIFRANPIFKYKNDLIVPSPSSLMWAIQSVIEEKMKNDSKQWEKYQKHKGKYLESEVASAFKIIFPNATIHQSLFYESVTDGELKKFEIDCLIIYDTNILLIESKSGVFSESARKGGIRRLERIIKDNIESAFVQAHRARDYINNSELPIFRDRKGNELLRIEKANYYRIFLVSMTLHNFGQIATMLQKYGKARMYSYDEYPVSLNINDLKIMAESITSPSHFLHYLHRRVKINNRVSDKSTIVTTDELDLFAHYFETNLFYDNENEYDLIHIPDYAPEFNQRYLLKTMGMPVQPLEQKLNPQFKKIISDLEDLGQFGFTNIIINLLDLSNDARENLIKYLDIISNKTRVDGKFHDFSMALFNNPNDLKSGVGITLTTGLLKDREKMAKQLFTHCQLKKNQQCYYEWIGIGRYIDSTRWFVDEATYMRYEEEYDEQLDSLASEYLRGQKVTINKIPRNSPCPCGSGVKYKKCHGK
ncbi:YecA family protein [Paenibacillus hexagrammi]|uniref:SEC-C domain-containing protein n=1 Tax=Paenibacillus hexagrammi TaxID=2908839 RepID=A0ABY3SE23_9BACL|nr:SEC-C metal-binding domain-containing protein [Paenibacillus sp. YPD9-1]UJF32171.1 SEC-C domain-containing protein [Paenibacillus sp. YPD9-1]